MIEFAKLYNSLDSTTKTNEKIAAMVSYFQTASHDDAAWAVYFLSGGKLKRLVPTKLLRQWAAEEAGIPLWLLEESYHAVGDLAEALSLIVKPGQSDSDVPLHRWVSERLNPLSKMDEQQQRDQMVAIWRETPAQMRFVVMKLITGALRVGVSKRLVTRSIAQAAGISADVVAHRLMGSWEPTPDSYASLLNPDEEDARISQPYPFCLAHPIDKDVDVTELGPSSLGRRDQYLAEWKWDGIRGQVIRRSGETFVWSRGEELMENRWPEIEAAAAELPDGTVIDGEILASRENGDVLPFGELQRRIGRKKVGKKLLTEVPVVFQAFDLLEYNGNDYRQRPLNERRQQLEHVVEQANHPHLQITEIVQGESWKDLATVRETSRDRYAEGLMLKRADGTYDVGRSRGNWWKWKIAPYTIDAVLIYAQKGHGKRSGLFTDYTFALWKDDALVPFAKAYSGLNDSEIRKVDKFVRQNTKDEFGPVRSVTPELVMELAFEGLQRSSRHKSGVATRFPRIVRWRTDKQAKDANTLDELMQWLPAEKSDPA